MSEATQMNPRVAVPWAPLLAIAATYFYFLIFAEFAFLELARGVVASESTLQVVMAALGVGGVAGAVGAAWNFQESRALSRLSWAFRGCAVAAGAALFVTNVLGLAMVALLVGLALGALTVLLAVTLRGALGTVHLGLGIGVGTGVAYALCNVPAVFQASPVVQTVLAVVVVLAASWLPCGFRCRKSDTMPAARASRSGVGRWTLILLALVWLDSAAFYIVQHTPALRAGTWSTSATLWSNAAIHLLAAVMAGWCIDRGWRVGVTALGVLALAGAALILNGTLPVGWSANFFYTAGVSLYSVVLVEFPARDGRPNVAALVFGVAGWVGSALGIGMAKDLAHIPTGFVFGALLMVGLALGGWRFARVGRGVVPLLLLALTMRADEVGRGRAVYIAEGCIHCHSQYVRPRVASEVVNWGPAATLEATLAAAPPLLGNRRQGPDLARVGNRRSPEWNRLHLLAPGAVSPGSRMPSYAHLFSGDGRGEALVAYLASLGSETMEARQRQIAAWRPDVNFPVSPAASAQLFQRLCTPCHGNAGRGDGPLASQLVLRPADWLTSPWRHVSSGEDPEVVLSRIIKFGILGLAMAGHEYLSDAEVVGLARYARILHEGRDRASP